MKIVSFLLFILSLNLLPMNINNNMNKKIEIMSVSANLYSTEVLNKIVILGCPLPNSPAVQNIEIQVFENDYLLYSFTPKIDFGYSPKISAFNFKNNGLMQIFYSADSGGSGGYGFYYVFDLTKTAPITLFDFEEFSEQNKYTGKFLSNFRAKISGVGQEYFLDVSNMDEFYKNEIYHPNGTVRVGQENIDVGFVNTVFPFYNSSLDRWLLQIYQKATAVAQVNVLGYSVTNLIYEDNNFTNFWQFFAIN